MPAYREIRARYDRDTIVVYQAFSILQVDDISDQVRRIHALARQGDYSRAERLLPKERTYPLPPEIARRLGCPIPAP